jgi:plasmid stability protein
MATLYVENVPDDLYEALRERARSRRRSIAAEVLALLEQNVPTKKELKARQAATKRMLRLKLRRLPSEDYVPVVEMIREDRER